MKQLRQNSFVIVQNLLCTTCRDTACLHVDVARQATNDELFHTVEAQHSEGLDYYILSKNMIIVIEDSRFHCLCLKVSNSFLHSYLYFILIHIKNYRKEGGTANPV